MDELHQIPVLEMADSLKTPWRLCKNFCESAERIGQGNAFHDRILTVSISENGGPESAVSPSSF